MSDKLITNIDNILNQKIQYIKPENIKKGVTVFGVEGTLEAGQGGSGDIKLFKTVEEMQADPFAEIGDLAIVYVNEGGEEITESTRFTKLKFIKSAKPNTAYFRRFDLASEDGTVRGMSIGTKQGPIEISGTNWDISIAYGSSGISGFYADGIDYEETDDGYIVDFGVKCYTNNARELNAFCTIPLILNFGGLYNYDTYTDNNYITGFKDFNYTDGVFGKTDTTMNIEKIKSVIGKLMNETQIVRFAGLFVVNENSCIVYSMQDTYSTSPYDDATFTAFNENQGYILHDAGQGSSSQIDGVWKIVLDLDNETYDITQLMPTDTIYDKEYVDTFGLGDTLFSMSLNSSLTVSYGGVRAYSPDYNYWTCEIGTLKKYLIAPTQLTLNSPEQLSSGVIGYGTNGVIVGTKEDTVIEGTLAVDGDISDYENEGSIDD